MALRRKVFASLAVGIVTGAACARCRFVGPTYREAYSGSVATSMPQAKLDEC
jgi:hypothetical protein